MRIYLRVVLAAVLLGFATPLIVPAGPAVADTTFGGFTAIAEGAVVRIGIYEQALPIPAEPQLDVSINYARSNTSTGPVSRGLASYLWPGDTVGDGLGVLFGDESLDYPVKVNSKYPASDAAPATNAIQITDGNGMSTTSDEKTTTATVTGLGVGGGLVSGIGKGLCTLLKQTCPDTGPGVDLPLPIATAATLDVSKSESRVHVGDTVTAAARVRATGLTLLGGLITIDGFDMNVKASSDAKTGKTDGTLAITGLNVAGKKVALGAPVDVDGSTTEVPRTPLDFPALGIKIDFLNRTKTIDGASGRLTAEGLTITVDVAVLGKQLSLGMLSDALAPVIGDIPQLGPLLTGLLKFGTKIVITVGDVRVGATASPQYVGPPIGPTDPTDDPTAPTDPIAGGSINGELPGMIGPDVVAEPPLLTDQPTTEVAAPFRFPGLGQTPSMLLLAALLLTGLAGWFFKGIGTYFFAADNCLLGASVGVPNLREG